MRTLDVYIHITGFSLYNFCGNFCLKWDTHPLYSWKWLLEWHGRHPFAQVTEGALDENIGELEWLLAGYGSRSWNVPTSILWPSLSVSGDSKLNRGQISCILPAVHVFCNTTWPWPPTHSMHVILTHAENYVETKGLQPGFPTLTICHWWQIKGQQY